MATAKELRKTLDDMGIEYETDANKPALAKLIEDAKPKDVVSNTMNNPKKLSQTTVMILEIEQLRALIGWMVRQGFHYEDYPYWREQKEKLSL